MSHREWPSATTPTKRKPLDLKLVSLDEMGELEAPSWMVRPLFETNSLVLLFGPANEGKTFVALSWALSIASGIPWVGHKVQQAPVIYVVGEGNRGIHKRGQVWKAHYDHGAPNCKFIQRPIRIVDDADRAEFIATLKPFAPKLVVLDTLATMTVGLDENDTAAMGLFTDACREISNALDASVLVVHHPTKGDRDTYRGSYQLEGNFDTMIRVRMQPAVASATPNLVLTTIKQKDEAKADPITVGTKLITLKPAMGDEDAVSSLVVVEAELLDPDNIFSGLTSNEATTLQAIIDLDKPRITTKEIVEAVSAKRGKDSKASVKNTWLPKLLETKRIERVEEGIYQLPEMRLRLVKPDRSEDAA